MIYMYMHVLMCIVNVAKDAKFSVFQMGACGVNRYLMPQANSPHMTR